MQKPINVNKEKVVIFVQFRTQNGNWDDTIEKYGKDYNRNTEGDGKANRYVNKLQQFMLYKQIKKRKSAGQDFWLEN